MSNERFGFKKLIYSENPILNKIKSINFIRDIYIKYFKKFDGRIIVYLTLACNLSCPYCVNEFHNKKAFFPQLSGKQWVDIINKEKRDVVFTGGEPTLHKDFIYILNNIDSDISVEILTNLKWTDKFLDDFINKVRRPVAFFASYHPPHDLGRFAYVLKKLKANGKFMGSVHAISTSKERDSAVRSFFKKEKISIGFDSDQYRMFEGCSKKFSKRVICSKNIYLIAPNGVRYKCVSNLLLDKFPLEDLKNERLKDSLMSGACNDYGFCAPCDLFGDIKIKKLAC
jgi:MoaA/NifB/PqqE/SkfB family radical SAM enzyme